MQTQPKLPIRLSVIAASLTLAFGSSWISVSAQEYEMPETPQEQQEESSEEPELTREELEEMQAQQAFEENEPTDYSGHTLAEMLESQPFFAHFYEALQQTELLNELDPEQRYTVFAPFDEAFARLPEDVYESWRSGENTDEFREFIGYHIVEGEYGSESLTDDSITVTTLNGDELELRSLYGAIMADHVSVNMPNIATAQGYVHGVDSTLLSPTTSGDSNQESTE